LLARGERVRSADPFGHLSPAEASVLATFMQRVEASPGDRVVRTGEAGDALYLIEAGRAEVRVRERTVAELGPGEYFGEVALLSGGERVADVVASTPMALLRLGRRDFERYLAHLVEVEERLHRTAAQRAGETARATDDR
jgi:CRP-like cAMP-binding protein